MIFLNCSHSEWELQSEGQKAVKKRKSVLLFSIIWGIELILNIYWFDRDFLYPSSYTDHWINPTKFCYCYVREQKVLPVLFDFLIFIVGNYAFKKLMLRSSVWCYSQALAAQCWSVKMEMQDETLVSINLSWLISPTGINISAALSLFERHLHHKGIILSWPVKFKVLVAHRHSLSKLLSWTETSQRNELLSHRITVICLSTSIFLSFCSWSLDLFQTCGEYNTDLYPAEFTAKKRSEFPWYNLGGGGKPGLACRAILTPACDEILLVSKKGLKTQPRGNRELGRKINNIQEL